MNQRTALLAGATGLVGGNCLQLLINDDTYERITILVRKPTAFVHPKVAEHIVDFDRLDQYAQFIKADDVYCCLGTTIRAAGSQDAFRRVDFMYPVQLGAISARNGADQFLIVTALGADPRSRIFYNRIKGETEQAVSKLPFEAIHVFRPSLLLGERKEHRRGEQIGSYALKAVSTVMAGPLRKYRPIEARVVANAMIVAAQSNRSGLNIYESDRIQSIHDLAT